MLPQSKKRVEEKPEEPIAYPVVQNYYYGYPQYYYKAPKPKLESSGDAHKIRLWFYVLLVPILWWLGSQQKYSFGFNAMFCHYWTNNGLMDCLRLQYCL